MSMRSAVPLPSGCPDFLVSDLERLRLATTYVPSCLDHSLVVEGPRERKPAAHYKPFDEFEREDLEVALGGDADDEDVYARLRGLLTDFDFVGDVVRRLRDEAAASTTPDGKTAAFKRAAEELEDTFVSEVLTPLENMAFDQHSSTVDGTDAPMTDEEKARETGEILDDLYAELLSWPANNVGTSSDNAEEVLLWMAFRKQVFDMCEAEAARNAAEEPGEESSQDSDDESDGDNYSHASYVPSSDDESTDSDSCSLVASVSEGAESDDDDTGDSDSDSVSGGAAISRG